MHPKNLHSQGYDFTALVKSNPALAPYVKPNAYGELSIDFRDETGK
ncbi:RlmF-related methyltransferase [Halomonas sp. BDJS001]|nr:RlmF-related methyltransferase [Halomonas sp. BDJS001]UZH12380.1 RlmF-related methyltransferase [Halomonas sp. BDJS001]